MSKSAVEYLKHILDELNYLISTAAGVTREEFWQDETLKRSFTRSLEIIGEAVKNLPIKFREQNNHIDWRSMAGMRDRLIHSYFGVDYEIVWDVVKNEAPKLKKKIAPILEEMNKI